VSHSSQTRALWAAVAGIPLLFAAIAALQVKIDAQTRTAAQEQEELVLRSPAAVKKLSLGYGSLLADIYWTRAVQYYGGRVATQGAKFDQLWPLLDITTTLDPKLMVAYRFGAIFLSETGIGGPGRSDLAVELVKRGIASNPDEWRLNSDLGFLYYWRLKDYPNAAAAYLEASKKPGAPPWLKVTAARVAQLGRSFDTSRMIWTEIYESTKDPNVRKKALEQLNGLKALEDESHLDELAQAYRKKFGRDPASTAEMNAAGLLQGMPVDPAGYPYIFGPDGKARLHPRSPVVIPPEPRRPGS
jgi:hypothetical protein